MPRYFIPKQSGPHRIACIALYRALLFHCSRLELPSERFRGPINPIKYLIRKQFRRNRHETSPRHIVTALKIGYEAEELLRTAVDGDKNAFSKILSLLKETQAQGDASRARALPKPTHPPPEIRKPEPYPDAPKVLQVRPRPLSELSGRRHVPVLTVANGIPFLRFKKPQSPFLSRIIRDKLNQRQRWLAQSERMQADMAWAVKEDEWDRLVGAENTQNGAVTFENTTRRARRESEQKLHDSQVQSSEIGKQMLEIVEEEKKLFEEERRLRREEKSRKRRERIGSGERSANANEPPESGPDYVNFKPVASGS